MKFKERQIYRHIVVALATAGIFSACTQKSSLVGTLSSSTSSSSGLGGISNPPGPTPTPSPSPVTTPNPTPISGSHVIKWNPGHYMASGSNLKNNGDDITSSGIIYELNDLANFPGMQGYLIYVYWAHLEPTQGNYNFSVLDPILANLKNQGKRLVIHLCPGPITGGGKAPGNGDFRFIPKYILTNPGTYGASLPSGDPNGYGGYWGASTGGYFPNFSNTNVMGRMNALISAIGQHYDSDPSFEAFVAINETADMSPVSAAGISGSTFVSEMEQIASMATAAFPHTSVMAQNTWSGSVQDTYNLASWMYSHRIAPSSPDTLGATGFENFTLDKPNGDLAWGLQAYLGIQDTGVTGVFDMRPGSRAMLEIQAPDMGVYQNVGASDGGPFAPTDIANAINTYYQGSHAFWTHLYGTEQTPFPAAAKWTNLAPAVLAIPLIHTAYPSNYP